MKTKSRKFQNFLKVQLLMGAVMLSLFAAGQTQTNQMNQQRQNQNGSSFNDWDKDSDNKISKEEFGDRYMKDNKNDWEGKRSGTGFYSTTYGWWDTNHDQRLSEDEWKNGYDNSYGDYVSDDYKSIDKNGDGYVDQNEYSNALNKTDYYSSFDTDRNNDLSDDEVSNMMFNRWDKNHNGNLDENEFNENQNNRY